VVGIDEPANTARAAVQAPRPPLGGASCVPLERRQAAGSNSEDHTPRIPRFMGEAYRRVRNRNLTGRQIAFEEASFTDGKLSHAPGAREITGSTAVMDHFQSMDGAYDTGTDSAHSTADVPSLRGKTARPPMPRVTRRIERSGPGPTGEWWRASRSRMPSF
jgi:hypothetical protein